MKLLSCHIENFGKLRDFTYYFEDDLGVLFAENGWGKSTLAAFLKVMFYGFDGENRRNGDGNERLRYRPWSGGVYGGSVTFSSGSKTFRMMRTFGARKKEDKFSLYDDETGFISDEYTDRIGEELFSIDRDSFCRTVFWSQTDHETSATTSIQAKIGDLTAQQDDLPAYDAAVKRLRKEMERLRPDRANGLIRKKQDRLALLEADQARLPSLNAQLQQCIAQEQALSEQLSRIRLQKQQYALSVPEQPAQEAAGSGAVTAEEVSAAEKRLAEARERLAAEQDRLMDTEERLAGERENLSDAEEKLSSLYVTRQRILAQGREEQEQYRQVKEDLRQELEAVTRLQNKRRSIIRAFSAAGILFAVILSALCLLHVIPMPFLILPILSLAGSVWLLWNAGHSDLPSDDSEEIRHLRKEKKWYKSSIRSISRKLRHLEDQIRGQKLLCEKYKIRIRNLEAGVSALKKSVQEAERDVNSSASGVPFSIEEDLVSSANGGSAPGTDSGSIPPDVAKTLSEFDAMEEECRSRLQDVRAQSEELREMISDCRTSQESLPALKTEISTLLEQYETCAKTLSYLEKARNLFTSRYMNPFLRSFRRYYGLLTGESAESVQTDADLGITILDQGLPRDPSLMSEGTKDMISLCRRMAMIDAMYPGEKPFLVLDDPFSNLDDERIKGGMRFLHTASLEYQILYLTCHASRL
ncbi:MAG: AAA family ATPase [Lachnospiraceae bacterium]|nr:AAA family ATPase [Lachnospiraceae bacterium]